jgi:hypothetical protein
MRFAGRHVPKCYDCAWLGRGVRTPKAARKPSAEESHRWRVLEGIFRGKCIVGMFIKNQVLAVRT